MTPHEHYESFIRGADPHDRRQFDNYLLVWLLQAVSDSDRTAALEAAAADVNGAA
jgi:hypothetical protein